MGSEQDSHFLDVCCLHTVLQTEKTSPRPGQEVACSLLTNNQNGSPFFLRQVFHALVMLFAFIDKQGNNNKNSKPQQVVQAYIPTMAGGGGYKQIPSAHWPSTDPASKLRQ